MMEKPYFMERPFFCFVIMPFSPKLYYFFHYLKQHIEQKYRELNVKCSRADEEILSIPFSKKIYDRIDRADLIIADCTGWNANVLYELGIAHALGKEVIYIMKENGKNLPADIQHHEVVRYKLGKDDAGFFNHLDVALRSVLADRNIALAFERAKHLFERFKEDTNLQVDAAGWEEFSRRVMDTTIGVVPSMEDEAAFFEFFFPKIIKDNTDNSILHSVTLWRMSGRQVH